MSRFLLETFLLGLKNLRLHKLRSLLTALGIIFGVAALIIMVSLGEGSKRAALDQVQQLGARNILIQSVKPPESSAASSRTQRTLIYGLKEEDFNRLRELPGLANVVQLRDTEQKVTAGDSRVDANAIGSTPEVFDIVNLRLSRGRLFNTLESDRGEAVCVIGATASHQLFPYEDPLGQTVKIGTSGQGSLMLTIVGVLEATGLRAGSEGAAMMKRDLDMDIYFPLSLARAAFGNTTVRRQAGTMERKQIDLTEIWLQAKSIEDVEHLASIAENIVATDGQTRNDVKISAPIQILRNAERLNRIFNFVEGGIAFFTLIVGGIGIMNIMLATVTERTREIGIRRALGAKRKHITLQFLIETTVISVSGGLIGIAFGSAFALSLPFIVEHFSGQAYPTRVAMWSVAVSFVASVLAGICFGLYPAIMAARMSPIEALRHE
ncbi:MAG: macB 2 [Phycisphaerales bacterium]|nr:macB 2 [Phycisphaerales bacterium]